MELGAIGTRRTYRSNMARYTRNPFVVQLLKSDSKPAYRVRQRAVCEATRRAREKKWRKKRENKENKKSEKDGGGRRKRRLEHLSECLRLHASRVSNPGEGLTLLPALEAVGPGVVSNVVVNLWSSRLCRFERTIPSSHVRIVASRTIKPARCKDLSQWFSTSAAFHSVNGHFGVFRVYFSIIHVLGNAKTARPPGFYVNWTLARYAV